MFGRRKNNHYDDKSKKGEIKVVNLDELTSEESKDIKKLIDDYYKEYKGEMTKSSGRTYITSNAKMKEMVERVDLAEFDTAVFENPYTDIELIKKSSASTSELLEQLAEYHSRSNTFGGNYVLEADDGTRCVSFDQGIPEMFVGCPIKDGKIAMDSITPVTHTVNGGWRYIGTDEKGRAVDISRVNSAMLMGDIHGCEGLYTPLHDPDAIEDSIKFLSDYARVLNNHFYPNNKLIRENNDSEVLDF